MTLFSAETWEGRGFWEGREDLLCLRRNEGAARGRRGKGSPSRMPSSRFALVAPLARQISKMSNIKPNIKPLRRRIVR